MFYKDVECTTLSGGLRCYCFHWIPPQNQVNGNILSAPSCLTPVKVNKTINKQHALVTLY